MKINPVYIVMVLGLLILVPFTRQLQKRPTSFYGIAENQDVDLSLEYPVRVKEIRIREGQSVETGQVLAILELTNVPFRRATLEQDRQRLLAEKNELLTRRSTGMKELEQAQEDAYFQIDNKLAELSGELQRNETLLDGLSSVDAPEAAPTSSPEISALQAERGTIGKTFELQRQNLGREVIAELQSLEARLQQIELDRSELDRQTAELELKAPLGGIVGTVNFVPGEQVNALETILNIYRLHPNQVITYIPEGQLTDLAMGDSLRISSLQNPDYYISGTIVGLGNKIRELPVRMRRDPAVQAWGREVLLQIVPHNDLMQGERVLVEQITE